MIPIWECNYETYLSTFILSDTDLNVQAHSEKKYIFDRQIPPVLYVYNWKLLGTYVIDHCFKDAYS